MTRSLLASLLLHAAALAFVWSAHVSTRSAPVVAFRTVTTEPAAEAEPALPEPTLPPPPAAVQEEWEPDEPEEPAEFAETEALRALPPDATRPLPRVRLARPLARPEPRTTPPPPPPPVEPRAAPATVAPSPPRARRCAPPAYPPLARRLGQEGTVRLRLSIDREGAVVDVVIVGGSGHRLLDRAAVEAARRWRFEPARRDGKPVASDLVQPVEFRLRGATAAFPAAGSPSGASRPPR